MFWLAALSNKKDKENKRASLCLSLNQHQKESEPKKERIKSVAIDDGWMLIYLGCSSWNSMGNISRVSGFAYVLREAPRLARIRNKLIARNQINLSMICTWGSVGGGFMSTNNCSR